MGLFEGLNLVSLRKDSEGRSVFFPYAPFGGKGRLVTSESLARIRALHSATLGGGLLFLVVTSHADWTISARLAFAELIAASYYAALHVIIKSLPISEKKYRWGEGASQIARAFGKPTVVAIAALTLFLWYRAVTLISERGFNDSDVFVLAFLMVATFAATFMIRACWRK
jgi:hypothetical protein